MLATDLYKTKRQQVFDFVKQKVWAKTSDVIRFGLSIYHTRADRDIRDFAQEAEEYKLLYGCYPQEGYIRRMPKDMQDLRFPNIHEDVWEFLK